MTFDELDRSLPNGFHDAYIKRIDVDYSTRTAALVVSFWVGTTVDPPERDRLRDGRVDFEGLESIVIEPPKCEIPLKARSEPWVDSYWDESTRPAAMQSLRVPEGCFVGGLWVHQWCSSIFVVARNARHTWLDFAEGTEGASKGENPSEP